MNEYHFQQMPEISCVPLLPTSSEIFLENRQKTFQPRDSVLSLGSPMPLC